MNPLVSYSLKHPFIATITKVIPLNKEGSSKSNHHVELSIKGSGINYQIGSSFGLLPYNNEIEVQSLLHILEVTSDERIFSKKRGEWLTVYDFFLKYVNVTRVTKKIAEALIPFQKNFILRDLLEGTWHEYTETHNLTEFLKSFYNKELPLSELVDLVSPMLPRFYSVASSQKVHGDTIHLLVADFTTEKGLRSLTTSHLLDKKDIPLFCQPNASFYPPEDDTPIIMIGPGTGLAAFLGFLQERIIFRKCKNNILFTGDRQKAYDFIYEEELTRYKQSGYLQLFTAFSRDSIHKTYVQDRMWEQKELLGDLILNQGAHIFVSGDATRMAKDVTFTLERIIASNKSISPEEAHLVVKELKKQKRFHLDVY
jgi:sulfite reductase (NADPH) flavoprotein alpha-component